jgi:hypothetical protein
MGIKQETGIGESGADARHEFHAAGRGNPDGLCKGTLVAVLLPWPRDRHESETFEHALGLPSRMTEWRQSEGNFTNLSP